MVPGPVLMPGFRFRPAHRLSSAAEFNAVFDGPDVRISNQALLFLAKRNGRGFNRLGMIVSKRNLPGSVDRNRVKRQIREAFRQFNGKGCAESGGVDVIVLARPGIRKETALTGVLERSLQDLSSRIEGVKT